MKQVRFIQINNQSSSESIMVLVSSLEDGYKILNVNNNGTGSVYYILEKDDYEI